MLTEKRTRRAILKQTGQNVSIPIPRANKSLQNDIKQKIAEGKYNLGVQVLDTSSTKLVMGKDGNIQKKELVTCKCKEIPLFADKTTVPCKEYEIHESWWQRLPIHDR